ncbi:MAG: DNA repair protein RadC [Synechococcales cyanobacterium CRU_2_2]|nr:DNA repair protein RadC [Synechococcales cyanobacterium CRU_2_2]
MTYILKDAPAAQLNNHRLRLAPQSSSPAELLSAALGISRRKARRLLDDIAEGLHHPLSALRHSEAVELHQAGLSEKEVARTHAIIELGRRLYTSSQSEGLPLESPDAVAAYLNYDLAFQAQEQFVVLVMNIKNVVIGKKIITRGSSTETIANPKQIFQTVLRMGGERAAVGHNHPSGSTTPSPEDLSLTEQLLKAAQTLDIELLDHLIIGGEQWTSLRQSTALWT